MTLSIALLAIVASASSTETWRVLFVADAGPVLFVELASTSEPGATGVERRADVTLVSASASASLVRSDRVSGAAPSASGVPSGPLGVTTTIEPNRTVLVTVSSAPDLVVHLRAHALLGTAPVVAHDDSFRIVLHDATSDDDSRDRAVTALVATTSGTLPGRAVVGRHVIPAPGEPTQLFTAGATSTIPRDALVVATVDGCGESPARAVLYRESDAPMQAILGPPGCARGAIVQRAERLRFDKRGVVRTTGVALTPKHAPTRP
jgi:hypothetical protein